MIPDLGREHALETLERVRARLAASHAGGHPSFTASFGLTDSTCGATLEQIILAADACLYASKEGGRHRACHRRWWSGLPASDPGHFLPNAPV